jgi:hypothetical protein
MNIDIIYIIISTEFEKNRMEYLTNYFQNNKIDIPIIYYEAYYKNRDEHKIDFNRYQNLKIPEIMLAYTYEKLLEDILKTEYKYFLILESDVLFCDNFKEKLNDIFTEWVAIAEHPSIIFIGNGNNLVPLEKTKISENLYEMNSSKCIDSILFDKNSIQYIHNKIKNTPIINISIDRLIDDMIGLEINSYWIKNPIILQGSQNGTYESTIQNVSRKNRRKNKIYFVKN